MSLTELTAEQLRTQIRNKEISCREVTDAFLERIEATDAQLNAFITVTADQARERADTLDKRLAANEDIGALGGVPIAIKDLLCTKGVRTTCASKMLENFVAPYNAHVIERLNAAGAVILGKTNMDEFAMGSSNETSYFGAVRNPWNKDCVPGGSSGGSAAAIAAHQAPLALGSDTGGSIRQPAALTGSVGLKPTYGRVSRYGAVGFASSMDQVGPMANNVTDVALLLNSIAGYDKRDSTSLQIDVPDYTTDLDEGVKGLRVGIPKEFFSPHIDTAVADAVHNAIDKLRELGAEIVEVSLPSTKHSMAVFGILAFAEASSNLARFDGIRYGLRVAEPGDDADALIDKSRAAGFGRVVRRRIMLGSYMLSAECYEDYYVKALKMRNIIRQEYNDVFQKCDILAAPTSETVAFRIGEKTGDAIKMKKADVFTVPINLAYLPAMSLPCGFQNGLPIGLQLIGNTLQEKVLLRAAFAYEQATEWHTKKAAL